MSNTAQLSPNERDHLREMLRTTLKPDAIEWWLDSAEKRGWDFEKAQEMADALASGAFL